MVTNCLLICFFLCIHINYCDKSLTLVLDTSNSMSDELDVIKANIGFLDPSDAHINDYILVPFSDPVVAEPTVLLSFNEFLTAVNRISLSGGRDCPEVALSGIEKALAVSKPRSKIFLFTDAYPKDINKLRSIETLCRNTLSQVVIFLTGFCTKLPVKAYYDTAKACSGTVFELNSADLEQVFKYIKEVIKMESTNIMTYDSFENYKEISFSVNSFTKSVILTVTGKHLFVNMSRGDTAKFRQEIVLKSSHAQVLRLPEIIPGEYTIVVRCQGTSFLTMYQKFELPLQIGFATEQPRSLKETSRRPMPGRENYVFIDVFNTIHIESIAVEVYNELKNKTLSLQEIITDKYLAKTFIDPDKSFRIWIYGYDKVTHRQITGSTETIIPQLTVLDPKWIKPKSEILEGMSVTINYGTKATLACKVIGYPKPSIWWEISDSSVTTSTNTVLLEVPSLYISYLNIENVTSNFTISCKCKNPKGEDSQSVEVSIYRPFTFEILERPQDKSIEYGSEDKLFCKVSAYPEAKITWYHNDSMVAQSDDIVLLPEESALLIRNMNLDNAGEYKCEVSNEMRTETFTAHVTVSGLEPPEVEVLDSNITLRLGEKANLECRIIKGKPLPVITWEFKSNNGVEFGVIPESATLEDSTLNIASAQSEHNGVYRCYARNVEGSYSAEIAVTVQYTPIIADSETSELVVKEDENVVLDCHVTAFPAANVWWELARGDGVVAFDRRHHTDERYAHRFKALDKDSGNYHCIAENVLGRAEKIIAVNVLVKPYITPPEHKNLTVRAGGPVNLACNVVFGNPVPSTKWQFIALDSSTSVILRGHSSLPLHINSVRHSNEGLYTCVAENVVGTDRISIFVKVQ